MRFRKFSKHYTADLASEFSGFLARYMEGCGLRVVPLADVFCLYNRARGIEFVAPGLLLQLCEQLATAAFPFRCRKTASGVHAIMHESFSDEALFALVLQHADASPGKSIGATTLRLGGVSVSFVKDLLHSMEVVGTLVRDETPAGLKYYRNII